MHGIEFKHRVSAQMSMRCRRKFTCIKAFHRYSCHRAIHITCITCKEFFFFSITSQKLACNTRKGAFGHFRKVSFQISLRILRRLIRNGTFRFQGFFFFVFLFLFFVLSKSASAQNLM